LLKVSSRRPLRLAEAVVEVREARAVRAQAVVVLEPVEVQLLPQRELLQPVQPLRVPRLPPLEEEVAAVLAPVLAVVLAVEVVLAAVLVVLLPETGNLELQFVARAPIRKSSRASQRST
jgi:hypothetical protein